MEQKKTEQQKKDHAAIGGCSTGGGMQKSSGSCGSEVKKSEQMGSCGSSDKGKKGSCGQ